MLMQSSMLIPHAIMPAMKSLLYPVVLEGNIWKVINASNQSWSGNSAALWRWHDKVLALSIINAADCPIMHYCGNVYTERHLSSISVNAVSLITENSNISVHQGDRLTHTASILVEKWKLIVSKSLSSLISDAFHSSSDMPPSSF